MKWSSKKQEQGSVLVITMVTCMVIATVLASYLALISSRYYMTFRSMCWNSAIPVLEAGIEEAMTHLHDDDTNVTANGWTNAVVGGQPVQTKRRNFADGSYCNVTIYNALSTNAIIYSSGFVPAPLGLGYISRMVRVTTAKVAQFPIGIAAQNNIQLNGGAVLDSYNSCLGAYSTNNSQGTNCGIATNSQDNPAISVGNAHVYGPVTTGPSGTVSINGGAVGDATWNATQTGIQAGWSDNDMNYAFVTNAPPTGTFLPPPVISAGGSNITWVGSGTWQMDSFKSTVDTKPMIVSGNAVLYVVGSIDVTGSGYIKILPGASLTLISGGKNNTIAGGGIVNDTGQPANFSYIGLPSNEKLTYSGSSAFVGTINAPQTDFTIAGSADFFGAAIVETFHGIGTGSFHYDVCLSEMTTKLIWTPGAWREL